MRQRCRFALLALTVLAAETRAQQPPSEPSRPKGWELVGLPALNFSSDEGFGYGVLAELYNYGNGVQPYKYTIQPTVFFTTKGRRDIVLFFDAPALLPNGWRLDAFVGREQYLATPYYGFGNDAPFDSTLERPPNPYFYRYGRTQIRVLANLQHRLGSPHARGLLGVGVADVKTDATPFDSGTTLLEQQIGVAPAPRGSIAYARAGLVWDTRDREIGPRSGWFSDLLVQRAGHVLGAVSSFTRVTGTTRKYVPLTGKLVFAQRLLLQQTSGDVPMYDAATIQTSFKQQEGLGGNNTIRGLPKNRFVGKGIAMSNTELRWRFMEGSILKKPMYLVLSGFVDAGRVWAESMKLSELASDLHAGYGGGLRVGLGPSFVVAFDMGRSAEATQIYIGLGYPF
jgi:outer membrane protein assembly factor BamA